MQTATLKEATTLLGISPDDVVYYQKTGNKAVIQIDIKRLPCDSSEQSRPSPHEDELTPEEEFRKKYPHIKINRPELFKFVGVMADVPPKVSDKDLILEALESKYGR